MRWVRNGYIIDMNLLCCVLSERAIHNKSYYSPLSSERGWGEAVPLFNLFALALGERLFHSTKRKGRNQIPPLLNYMLASFTSIC